MFFSRRQFVLGAAGAAAGLILPRYYERVLRFVEDTGEPLLIPPRETAIELIAVDHAGLGRFELNWGNPWEEPPEMTIRQFALRYWGSEEAYLDGWYVGEEIDFDAPADPYSVMDCWARQDSPNARAYRLLEKLDVGPQFKGRDAVGEIDFVDGPCPGNDYLGVEAVEPLSLSLLQQRLNDLGTNIRLSVAPADPW